MLSKLILAAISLVDLVAVVNGLPYSNRQDFKELLPAPPCDGKFTHTSAPSVSQRPMKHEPTFAVQTTTNLEVDWSFFCHDGICLGEIDFSVNDGTNTLCTDTIGITNDWHAGVLNGRQYYSSACDIYAIIDGSPQQNNFNEAPFMTYTAGHGVNCGWVSSPGHTGISDGAPTVDYFHHCRFG